MSAVRALSPAGHVGTVGHLSSLIHIWQIHYFLGQICPQHRFVPTQFENLPPGLGPHSRQPQNYWLYAPMHIIFQPFDLSIVKLVLIQCIHFMMHVCPSSIYPTYVLHMSYLCQHKTSTYLNRACIENMRNYLVAISLQYSNSLEVHLTKGNMCSFLFSNYRETSTDHWS